MGSELSLQAAESTEGVHRKLNDPASRAKRDDDTTTTGNRQNVGRNDVDVDANAGMSSPPETTRPTADEDNSRRANESNPCGRAKRDQSSPVQVDQMSSEEPIEIPKWQRIACSRHNVKRQPPETNAEDEEAPRNPKNEQQKARFPAAAVTANAQKENSRHHRARVGGLTSSASAVLTTTSASFACFSNNSKSPKDPLIALIVTPSTPFA